MDTCCGLPDAMLKDFPYRSGIIMTFIGGSALHGAKLEGTDDTDWFGVFVEPPAKKLGIDDFEHFVTTTGGKEGGNVASDVDICLYSLGKWARLAAKGNPSVLHFLFAQEQFCHIAWAKLHQKRDIFLARAHVNQFLGYANAQLQRLCGNKGQKDCHRPFLEEQFGYDTKYAMHDIRLLHEAKELLLTGNISFPRQEVELLKDIRRGKYKLYEIIEMANQLEVEVLAAKEHSPLPEKVNRADISSLIADVYRLAWDWAK